MPVWAKTMTVMIPENMPLLGAPVLNDELNQAMGKGNNILDKQLYLSNGLLGRAMVPLLKVVGDTELCHGNVFLSKDQALDINESLKLLTAVINYVNHSRKVNVRYGVRDDVLKRLCSWECDVGSKELFWDTCRGYV